jgi:anti-sigma factor RsiW
VSGHVLDLLSAYLDDELSPPERGMVDAHLAACEECAARLEDFAAVDGALRDLPIEAPADYFKTFSQRVRGRLRGRGAPARRLPVWTWAAAAALLLAVLTPLTLQRTRETASPARAPAEPRPETVVDSQKQLTKKEVSRNDAPLAATVPAPRRVPAPTRAPLETREQAEESTKGVESGAFAEPPPPPPQPAVPRGTGAPAPASAPAALEEALLPDSAAPARKVGRADERVREREAAPRDADAARAAGESGPGTPGLRAGVSGGTLGRQEADAGDEFGLLRARSEPGAGDDVDELRDLRDDWRSFAARNPSGTRGDEARWQVIEVGLRAWHAGDDAGDRAIVLHDARTYLERGDGAYRERVRAVLAEVSSGQ